MFDFDNNLFEAKSLRRGNKNAKFAKKKKIKKMLLILKNCTQELRYLLIKKIVQNFGKEGFIVAYTRLNFVFK